MVPCCAGLGLIRCLLIHEPYYTPWQFVLSRGVLTINNESFLVVVLQFHAPLVKQLFSVLLTPLRHKQITTELPNGMKEVPH